MRRVKGVIWRHLYFFPRSLDRIADSVYWPILDIVLWGLTSSWLLQQKEVPGLVLAILTALVFWQIVWRASYEISVNLLEELWNTNLVNLFSSPLTFGEWVAGILLMSLFKLVITVVVGFGAVWLLYSLNIIQMGWLLIPYMINLIIFGWTVGMFTSAFIIYFGLKIQTIAWVFGFIFAPFSAVYYPVSQLPVAIQPISRLLPATYVFEGLRQYLFYGIFNLEYLFVAAGMNVIYFLLAFAFFKFMFIKSKQKGLARLE